MRVGVVCLQVVDIVVLRVVVFAAVRVVVVVWQVVVPGMLAVASSAVVCSDSVVALSSSDVISVITVAVSSTAVVGGSGSGGARNSRMKRIEPRITAKNIAIKIAVCLSFLLFSGPRLSSTVYHNERIIASANAHSARNTWPQSRRHPQSVTRHCRYSQDFLRDTYSQDFLRAAIAFGQGL